MQAQGGLPYPGGSIHCDTMFDQHVCHWNMAFLCYQVERSESTLKRNRCASTLSQGRIPGYSDRTVRLESLKPMQHQLGYLTGHLAKIFLSWASMSSSECQVTNIGKGQVAFSVTGMTANL